MVDVDGFTGITLIIPLSTQRLDRLPLHLSHWNDSMSISIHLEEAELEEVAAVITRIQRPNIRFTLYILKKTDKHFKCTFFQLDKSIAYESCYAINILRNLAIETIQTSHYLISDGDAILTRMCFNVYSTSGSFKTNIMEFSNLLVDEHEIFLIPLIPYDSPYNAHCKLYGNCTEAYLPC